MEFWEVTKDRAQKTVSYWNQYLPTLKVGAQGVSVLSGFVGEFEPAAQARTTVQDDFDAAVRAVNTSLLKMKILSVRVAQLIDGHLSGDAGIVADLADVFGIVPRTEPTILARARALYPVWVRANTALAALTPAGPPITRVVQGVPHTAAMLKALLDGYTDLTQVMDDKGSALNKKRGDLRLVDRKTDRLNKAFYQVAKNTFDAGTPEYEALDDIPVEEGTPAPDQIDIHELAQGGPNGLEVLVSYEPGGGDHATTREVQWMVVGADADFTHTTPLDPSGNALGPFTVGQVVKVRTSVSNSSGTRTCAVRTITLETPI